jgi:hypothetical protein
VSGVLAFHMSVWHTLARDMWASCRSEGRARCTLLLDHTGRNAPLGRAQRRAWGLSGAHGRLRTHRNALYCAIAFSLRQAARDGALSPQEKTLR